MFGLVLLLWGIWVFLPGSAFATSLGYHWIAHLVPETVAGIVAMLLGAIQMASAITGQRKVVIVGGLGAFYFWLLLTISFIVGSWQSAGVVVYGWLCIMNGLGYINWRINR